jgi:3-hydroxybutyryl-CoA dehydrogenase
MLAAPRDGGPSATTGSLPAATIVERVNLALINEAYRAVEERVASPQDVDTAIKLGVNHPLGPFERAGQLGLRAVVEGLRRQHQAARLSGDQYEVAPILWQIATA